VSVETAHPAKSRGDKSLLGWIAAAKSLRESRPDRELRDDEVDYSDLKRFLKDRYGRS